MKVKGARRNFIGPPLFLFVCKIFFLPSSSLPTNNLTYSLRPLQVLIVSRLLSCTIELASCFGQLSAFFVANWSSQRVYDWNLRQSRRVFAKSRRLLVLWTTSIQLSAYFITMVRILNSKIPVEFQRSYCITKFK